MNIGIGIVIICFRFTHYFNTLFSKVFIIFIHLIGFNFEVRHTLCNFFVCEYTTFFSDFGQLIFYLFNC
ncbi:hypothetical protein A7P25_00050 [Achromobacter xylosoxidans]|nr:hypothetical protein A7P25_00050 [Achromobacter xylosoxidans]